MFVTAKIGLCRGLASILCLAIIAAGPAAADSGSPNFGFRPVQKLLDLSGLARIDDTLFLAVHDAIYPDEKKRVRVSLLMLPDSLDGIQWKPLHPRFPGPQSSDLESASRIPGTRLVLLVESGDDAGKFDRIFLALVKRGNKVVVRQAVEWRSFYPAIFNVEATAVARTAKGFLFIWGERAEGSAGTVINWTDLELNPFTIGSSGVVSSAKFTLPPELADLYNRPLVGMDVGDQGQIYGVAAYDPDSDEGPFSSAVLKLGRVSNGSVVLDTEPGLIATLDGFKTESVAVLENGQIELFAGTDDENYGGTLRLLPPQP